MDCSSFNASIYTPLEACVLLTPIITPGCPSIWATLSALINILLGSFSCFFASASLWGWNNPVQRCLPVGEGCIIHAGGVVASRATDELLMCNRRRPAATSSRRASFSALASANSFVYFASAQQHHADASRNGPAFASFQFSGIFVALGFVGNGVITVMINSPWQADDDADNQSGDNRGDSAHTIISLTVPPTSLNFTIRLSALCSNWP